MKARKLRAVSRALARVLPEKLKIDRTLIVRVKLVLMRAAKVKTFWLW